MGTQLSHKLLDLGFLCALGTRERRRDLNDLYKIVEPGTPFTFDKNQGMTVVYDERGRPWVMPNSHVQGIAVHFRELGSYGLKLGAYVPHSNDGGEFRANVIPMLLNKLA